ncbi:hypothetical protein EBS67_04680 [bacterium]|nr:hypothetical protein [bacterium]
MKVLHEQPTLFEIAAVILGAAAILSVIWIAIMDHDAQAVTVLNTVVGAATGTFFLNRQAGQPTDDGKKGVVPPTTAKPPAETPTKP